MAIRSWASGLARGLVAICIVMGALALAPAPPAHAIPTITEFPIPTTTSVPGWIAADSDGSVWFTEAAPPIVGKVSPDGTVTEYPIPTDLERLSGIVVGADGNLWFGEWDDGRSEYRIGRMSRTGGGFVEFPIPPSVHGPEYRHNPRHLVLGPDGNVWFTAGDALGRITPAGLVSLFYLPLVPCGVGLPNYGQSYGLTVGPDGALWFVDGSRSALFRFDLTTHALDPIQITPPCTAFGAALINITTGPDGNLWTTDRAFDRVFRVSPSGSSDEFSVPGGPNGITSADGRLWVTRFANQITELDTSGTVVTDIPIPTPDSGPTNITPDSAGNLWFVEEFAHKIGRVNLAPPLIGPPTEKAQCKHGGWRQFNNPAFKNQGKCFAFLRGTRP